MFPKLAVVSLAVREKTSVSSFDVYVVVEELRQRLLGSKVDNLSLIHI